MNAEDIDPYKGGGHTDSELDAILGAADERLLDILRRGLNLDTGLAQILGHPSRREVALPDPAASATLASATARNSGAVSNSIAALRFDILEVQRNGKDAFSGTSAALLNGAASNLKDLHRGLEARELTRYDAISLLDQVNLSLEKALDTQQLSSPRATRFAPHPVGKRPKGRHREKKRSWLRWMLCAPTWLVCLAIVIPVLAAAGAVFALTPLIHGADALIDALIIPVTAGFVFMTTLVAGPAVAVGILHRRAARILELRSIEIETARFRQARGDSSHEGTGEPDRALSAGRARRSRRRNAIQLACEVMYLNVADVPPEQGRNSDVVALQSLRDKLERVRPEVVRLFDEADDRSSSCTPHA
jgi:hypothetical protein